MIVNPKAAHRVVRRRINPHRHLVGVFPSYFFIDVEDIAVLFAYLIDTHAVNGIGKVQVDTATVWPDTSTLVTHLFSCSRSNITRDQITEVGIAAFEIVIAVTLLNIIGSARVAFLLWNPHAPVIAQ